MYHVENSLYFERLHDGSVRIVKTDGRAPDAVGVKVLFEQTLPPNLWVSGVLSMSAHGERPNDLHKFMDHHHGRVDALADAARWRLVGQEMPTDHRGVLAALPTGTIRRFFCWIGHHRPRCLVLANFDGEHFATQYIRCDSCGIRLSGYEEPRP